MVTELNCNVVLNGIPLRFVKSIKLSIDSGWVMERFATADRVPIEDFNKAKVPLEVLIEKVFVEKIESNDKGGVDFYISKLPETGNING